jgi:hypothetical protein
MFLSIPQSTKEMGSLLSVRKKLMISQSNHRRCSMHGWLYIIKNQALAGMIKLGRSDDPPTVLIKKLDTSGAVPSPFQLSYMVFVNDSFLLLQNVRRVLWAQQKNFGHGWFPRTSEEGISLIRNQIALYILERIRLEIRNGHGNDDFDTVMRIIDSVLFLKENIYLERNSINEAREIAKAVADIMKHQCWMQGNKISHTLHPL